MKLLVVDSYVDESWEGKRLRGRWAGDRARPGLR